MQKTVILKHMITPPSEPSAQYTDVCPTIMARDYKGLNNYGMGGCLCITKREYISETSTDIMTDMMEAYSIPRE